MTYNSIEKLALFTEDEFFSDPRLGFLSSSKSKFIDKNQVFWLSRTLGKLNPNLHWNEKTDTVEDYLQIQFSASEIGKI